MDLDIHERLARDPRFKRTGGVAFSENLHAPDSIHQPISKENSVIVRIIIWSATMPNNLNIFINKFLKLLKFYKYIFKLYNLIVKFLTYKS